MVIIDKNNNRGVYRIIITPNRSIAWPQLVRIYLFICFTSFSIALLFAFSGYWVVLPFSGLEMLALGMGLYVANRKIYRQEVITLSNDSVLIEKGCHSPDEHWEFDKHWLRLTVEKKDNNHRKTLLFLGSHGKYVEIGSFLDESEKESLVFELNEGIISPEFL